MEDLGGLVIVLIFGICLLAYATSSPGPAPGDAKPPPPPRPRLKDRIAQALWGAGLGAADDDEVYRALKYLEGQVKNGALGTMLEDRFKKK